MILATTTVAVEERTDTAEPYEAPTWATAVTGVPAHIGQPIGTEQNVGGAEEAIDAVLLAEAGTDLTYLARVLDETTGERFEVVWVQPRQGLGLDHVKAGLRRTQGLAG